MLCLRALPQLEEGDERRIVLRRHRDPVARTSLLRRLPVLNELTTRRVVAQGSTACGRNLDLVERRRRVAGDPGLDERLDDRGGRQFGRAGEDLELQRNRGAALQGVHYAVHVDRRVEAA